MPKADPVLAAIERVGSGARRSPLSRYMRRHHDALAVCLAGGRADWEALCEAFRAGGLTAAGGRAVTPHIARITWQRVRKAVEREALRRAARQTRPASASVRCGMPPLRPGEHVPGVRSASAESVPAPARPIETSPLPRPTAPAPGDVPAVPGARPALALKLAPSRFHPPKTGD